MLARLEFDLTDPDDKNDFEIFCQAKNLYSSLIEFGSYLREQFKYSENEPKLEQIIEKYHEILEDNLDFNIYH